MAGTAHVPGPTAYVEPDPEGDVPSRLAHFPVTFFATIMGLSGLSLAWTRAVPTLGVPAQVGRALFWISLAGYVAILTAYAAKVLRQRAAVRAELAHPVRLSFLPTITIALLLVATAGQDVAHALSGAMWWVGTIGQLVLTLYVLSAWINRSALGVQHVTPAWFIPVVGLVVVPLAGVGHGHTELSWFFFSVGITFWIPLLSMVLARLFTHEQPLPPRLLPTLAVLIAPPAVAALAYLRLTGGGASDPPVKVLYYSALFFALLFVTQLNRLRRLPFFLSWWAYSFPLAALSTVTSVMARESGGWFFTGASWVFLVAVTALILLLTVRTVADMARGRICVPE